MPVGMQSVVDGVALAEELRVPSDLDFDVLGRESSGTSAQLRAVPTGTVDLPTMTADRKQRDQSVDHSVNMAKVSAVFALLLGRSDAEEVHVGELHRSLVVGGEVQPAGFEVVPQHLSQARFVERNVAGGQCRDLSGSTSTPTTSWPSSAMPAAWVAPR